MTAQRNRRAFFVIMLYTKFHVLKPQYNYRRYHHGGRLQFQSFCVLYYEHELRILCSLMNTDIAQYVGLQHLASIVI